MVGLGPVIVTFLVILICFLRGHLSQIFSSLSMEKSIRNFVAAVWYFSQTLIEQRLKKCLHMQR